ncbi:MAG: hypothetical protein U0132_12780 [Gemmatimonadaceae bacterium]
MWRKLHYVARVWGRAYTIASHHDAADFIYCLLSLGLSRASVEPDE